MHHAMYMFSLLPVQASYEKVCWSVEI